MRGHIRQRGKGIWAIVLELDRGPDGKRRQKWHTVRGTRREAERELARLLHERHTGAYVEPTTLTVGEHLDRWLADCARPTTRPTTYESYAGLVERHLKPALGALPLQRLTAAHLQRLYAEKLAGGRADGQPGGLSPRTVRYLHAIVHMALRQAVAWGLVTRNVAEAATPPRPERRPVQAWDLDQARHFLQFAAADRLYALFLLAITAGLRRGELLGLRWRDVDLARGVVAVRQTLTRSGGALIFQEPKTDRSRRTVALSPLVVAALRRRREEQAEERGLLGLAGPAELVFDTPIGTPIDPRNFIRRFEAVARAAGAPRIRVHDLRHTSATLMLLQGEHPKIVSERLGHTTVGQTLDTYSHVLPGLQAEAARKLEAQLFGTAPAAPPHKRGRATRRPTDTTAPPA